MKLTLKIIICLAIAGCYKKDEAIKPSGFPQKLIDIVARDTTFSMFYKACKLNGIDTLLSGNTFHTIIVPPNYAFRKFGINEWDLSKSDDLKKILLYHFVEGRLYRVTNTLSLNKNNLPISIFYSYPTWFNKDYPTHFYNIPASNGMMHIIDKLIARPTLQHLIFKCYALQNATPMYAQDKGATSGLLWDPSSNVTFFSPTLVRYPSNLSVAEYEEVVSSHITKRNINRDEFFDGQIIQTLNPKVSLKVVRKNNVIKLTADNIHFSTLLENDVTAINGKAYNMDSSIVK